MNSTIKRTESSCAQCKKPILAKPGQRFCSGKCRSLNYQKVHNAEAKAEIATLEAEVASLRAQLANAHSVRGGTPPDAGRSNGGTAPPQDSSGSSQS